ncbi:MAG: HD domain-containing protein [Proteobacteria bacterium]|nr:HD domain-containing protein [Pseudomonadota bacterium]
MNSNNTNPLLRSWLTIFAVWYVALWLYNGAPFSAFATSVGISLTIAGVGIAVGVLVNTIITAWTHGNDAWILNGETRHGATVTLGRLPVAPRQHFRRWWQWRRPAKPIAKIFPWFKAYAKRHPPYAAAFKAAFRLMEEVPNLPASPVKGGHGGVTLLQHSASVIEVMAELVPTWRYTGHRNRKGEVTFPLIDTQREYHAFAPDDPLLPLTALAHDIGKLACYKLQVDGSVVELFDSHAIHGAKILRGIPVLRELPFADWTALLVAVEYYHEIQSLPRASWIDDRTRSLTELLINADNEAGRREGRQGDTEAVDPDATNPPLPYFAPHEVKDPDTPEVLDAVLPTPIGARNAPAKTPSVAAPRPSPTQNKQPPRQEPRKPAAPQLVDDDTPTAFQLADMLLCAPNRVNGTDSPLRVAYKFDGWLYINESRMRNALADMTEDASFRKIEPGAEFHSFTVELMAELHAKRMLLDQSETFSCGAAMYKRLEATTQVDTKVIVVKEDAFPWTAQIPNCVKKPAVAKYTAPTGPAPTEVAITKDAPPVSPPEPATTAAEVAPESPGATVSKAAPAPNAPPASGPKTSVNLSALAAELTRKVLAREIKYLERPIEGDVYACIPMAEMQTHFPDVDWDRPVEGIRIRTGASGNRFATIPVPDAIGGHAGPGSTDNPRQPS